MSGVTQPSQPSLLEPTSDAENRRRDDRKPIELRVEYRRLNTFLADYTRNISRGGTFIRTEKPMAVGTVFAFSLAVPGLDEPLELTGKVVWCVAKQDTSSANHAGMGIEFQFGDGKERERIDTIIRGVMVGQLGEKLTSRLLDNA